MYLSWKLGVWKVGLYLIFWLEKFCAGGKGAWLEELVKV
jgi:hypothetical protein